MIIKLNYKIIGITIALIFIGLTTSVSLYNYSIATVAEASDVLPIPIIMYHQTKNSNLGKDVISPSEFEADLKYLKENNYTTITMTQLIDYVYKNKPLPEKPIILTFDDGYYNNYKYVFPLLQEYNMKIVLSIIAEATDEFSEMKDGKERAHMTWEHINEMLDAGCVEIQNHTYDLHSMKKRIGCTKKRGETVEQYKKVLMEDLTKAQERIKEMTGTTPNTFVYPYGKMSKETNDILKDVGFKATLNCGGKMNYVSKDPEDLLELKRLRRDSRKKLRKAT